MMKRHVGLMGLFGLAGLIGLGGCTQFSGVVLDAQTKQPITTAVITEGLPKPDYAPKRYWVDQNGHFSFQTNAVLPQTTFYIWRGANLGEPNLNSTAIPGTQMAQNMTIMLQPRRDFQPAVMPMTMPAAPLP